MASVAERNPRRTALIRVLLTLTLTTLFAVGIVALMMVLAGVFQPKVSVRSEKDVVEASSGRGAPAEGVVRIVRRPRQESAVGTIRAVYEAVVASKILARVEEVRVKAGQEVKQGDVLVVLDKADLKSRIEQARPRRRRRRRSTTRRRSTWAGPSGSGRASRSRRASSTRRTPPADGEGRARAGAAGGGGGPDRRRRTPPSARRSPAGSSTRRSTPATPSAPASRW